MTKEEDILELKEMRNKVFLTACFGSMTHLASTFSVTERFYLLYQKGVLRINFDNPSDVNRGRRYESDSIKNERINT